jgi:hypothetical protein
MFEAILGQQEPVEFIDLPIRQRTGLVGRISMSHFICETPITPPLDDNNAAAHLVFHDIPP